MSEYLVQDTTLTAIADAVRAKKGTTEPIALTDFAAEIESIQSGGGSASNKLALVVGAQSADNPYDIIASDLEGVAEIKGYTFGQCKGLRSITLPTICTSIGQHAFRDCTSLISIDMPNVTRIGIYAFQNCSSLPSVDIPNVTSIGMYVFQNCSSLPSVDIPNVTSIGEHAFEQCSSLTSISMPSATSIGKFAFYKCYALTSVLMPNIIDIGASVFGNCNALTSLTIPNTCTSMGSNALQPGSSTNKCTFTFEGTTPPSIQSSTFNARYINKIIVPVGCGETYKTATNWTTVADYIVEATG